MIIKSKDETRAAVATLEELLAVRTISTRQREAVEEELHNLRCGAQGEREAAYQIDFQLKDSKNWAVIHDLRLEYNGRVAQIDHLLIGRFFDIFVIESKNIKTALRVDANCEFQVKTRWGWQCMASPIEQNRRHITVLNELICRERLTPTRLGMTIKPAFRNWILVPPECHISDRHVEEAIILKMDMFNRRMDEFTNQGSVVDVLSVAKICSSETIVDFAQRLVSYHRPVAFDYAARFGINLSRPAQPTCEQCQVAVEPKVATYCLAHANRFGDRILCRECQARIPAGVRALPPARRAVAKTATRPPRSRPRR